MLQHRDGIRGRSVALAVAVAAGAVGVLAGCGNAATSPRSTVQRITVRGSQPTVAAGPDWPTLLHSPAHFGAATVTGPSTATVRWQRRLEGAIVPGPVTLGEIAYVASNGGVLHALDIRSGKDRWTSDGGGSYGSDLSTAPALLRNGLILWPGPRQRVFALTPQGKLRWTLSLAADPLTPTIDSARHLLVIADTAGGLSAYRLTPGDAALIHLWSRSLAATSYGNPALANNGTIYETAGNSLFAVSTEGRVLWQVKTPSQVEVSAAVADDGTVVFGSNDSREYGVSPTGQIRWRYPIGNYTYSSPLTLAGHRVVSGNHSGDVSILDTHDGHLISRAHGGGQLWTAAAVDARGDLYFASRTGGIYAFAADGRRLFSLHTTATFDSYPAIAGDGTLLIGDDAGLLRAIR